MSKEFGSLLNKMLEILKAKRGQSMKKTLEYVGGRIGSSSSAIYKWRAGANMPIDINIVRTMVDLGVSEAGMDKIWAERMLRLGDYPERTSILNALFPELNENVVLHNLPRRPYIRLIGREDKIAEIEQRLAPEERHWIIPIEGVGGVGKTALALEVGWRYVERFARLPLGRRFNAVIWVSAKREVLTTQGIESIMHRSTLTNLDDVYSALAEVLDWSAILRVSHEKQLDEVRKALRQIGRTLIILDNLETVNDPQVFAFLRDLPPPAKAIVTMRFHEDMPYPIRLKELNWEAAKKLVNQEAESRRVILEEDQIQDLLKYTQGLPLAIWWAVGLMGMEGLGVGAVIDRLSDSQADLLHFIYDQAVEFLQSDSNNLPALYTLIALTYFDIDIGAPLSALISTAGFDEETISVALHKLMNLNLVNRMEYRDRYTMLPLTNSYTQAKVKLSRDWEMESREQWLRHYQKLLKQNDPEDWPSFGVLDQEYRNIFMVIAWALDVKHPSAPIIVKDFWYFLYIRGYWSQCIMLTQHALELAKNQGDEFVHLWLSARLGWILNEQSNTDEALGYLQQVEVEINELDNLRLLVETDVLNYLGQVYIEIGDLDKAELYQSRFLKLAEKFGDLRGQLTARYYLALIGMRKGNDREAEEGFRIMVEESRNNSWDRGEAYGSYRLASLLIEIGKLDEAEDILEKMGSAANYWKEKLLQGHVNYGLARLYYQRGRLFDDQEKLLEARQYAENALDGYLRLNAKGEVQKVQRFLADILNQLIS